jgi:hypothetical protein
MTPTRRASALPLVATLALLAACSTAERDQGAARSAPSNATATASASSSGQSASAAGATAVAEADSLVSFAYSYPATGVAELDRWLAAQLAEARTQSRKEATDGKREADAGGFPYRRYEYDTSWTLAGRTPQLVSLVQETSAYTGGAHGNSGTAPTLWDRAARRTVNLDDLLVSKAGFQAAIRPAGCAALDQLRRERRGADASPLAEFNRCPDLNNLAIVPTGDADAPFTALTVIADPYVAGPYVEGAYKMRIPLTAAVVATIKPEWRTSFTPAR